jgi:Carboxypeptidase regulatory-like domain/TonB dependent receptor
MNSSTSAVTGKQWTHEGKIVRVLAVAAAIMFLGLPLFSQVNYGRIFGRVTDATGAVIAGTSVTITNVGTGTARNLTTDDVGEYNAPALNPGTYMVRVSATGFTTVERRDILLEIGKDIRIDVQLTPGGLTQTVEVTGAAPMMDTSSVTLGGTLSNETINDLPLNGRNYVNLVSLRPGMQQYPGGGGWTTSSNGLRVDAQNWMIDGMDNNESYLGQQVINSEAPAGDSATILPIDAIQEFNIEENPKAELGWSSGAVVNVGIKSGSNQLHGTAYAYGRSGAWDARNFFNSGPQNPLGLEQWGGTIGGRIVKDKLFYFAGFENQRYELGVPEPLIEPTNLPGDPSVSIPAATAALQTYCSTNTASFCSSGTFVPNALSQKLLPFFGTSPNASGNVTTNLNATNNSNNVVGKVDYNINSRHTLSVMYFLGNDSNISEDFPVTQQQFLTTFLQRGQTFVAHWTWTPNTRWVNEARFGFVRWNQPVQSVDHATPATTYGINTGVTNPLLGGMPLIFVNGLGGGGSGGSGIGGNLAWPYFFGPDNNFDFVDQVSYLHGSHAFKWGGEVRFATMSPNPLSVGKGDINFLGRNAFPDSTALEDFLTGSPTYALLLVGSPLRHLRQTFYSAFAQDDWRATPRVTLNLGVRWEYARPLTEADNLLANWNPAQGLISAGGSQGSSVYNRQKTNFAPRLGVAWDVTGKGTTVIRAGGGLYYDSLPSSVFVASSLALQNFPTPGISSDPTGAYFVNSAGVASQLNPRGIASGTLFFPGPALNWNTTGPVFNILPVACGDGATAVTSGPAALIGTTPQPCNIFAVAKNFQTPYVINWMLSVQHAFTNSLSLEVAYVGNHGAKLTGVLDQNQINPQSPAEIACGQCEANSDRPYANLYPNLGFINMLTNAYRSNYHSLQATLTGRNYHGMNFVLGYTYAHALDSMSFSHYPVLPQDSTNPAAEYASSDIDVRHRLTLSWTYNVPEINAPGQILKGWAINTIVTLQSPMPWPEFDTNNDISRTGEKMDRWDFSGNPADFSGSGTAPIPFFLPGTPPSGDSLGSADPAYAINNQSCVTAATNVPNGPGGTTGLQSLSSFGCYVKGSSVLVPPSIGSFGTTARNIFRDSGYRNMDLSVFKNFKFKERLTAQFRAEFFNVLNHPHFANPFGGITGWGVKFTSDPSNPSSFGCGCRTPDVAQTDPVLGTGGARDIQLGLKLIW